MQVFTDAIQRHTIIFLHSYLSACNEVMPHCTNCTSMDVCRVFGPVRNLTCHNCAENYYVGQDHASCRSKLCKYGLRNLIYAVIILMFETTSHNHSYFSAIEAIQQPIITTMLYCVVIQ